MEEDDFLTAVGDLRDLLHDIPEWRLLATDWPEVREALRAARSAVSAADAARLQDLVADLELLSPLRMQSRPGSQKEPTPPPDDVNVLVHDIELKLDVPDDEDQEEAEEGDGRRR